MNNTTTTHPSEIGQLAPHVRDFNDSRAILKERCQNCQTEQTRVVRKLYPGIKSAADKTRDAQARLLAQIELHPHLFTKPRTVTIEGTRIGFKKGKGKILTTPKTVELIRKHLPDQADALIITRRSVNKAALAQLPANDLKRIACTIEDAGDQALIAAPKDDLEKLVDSLLADHDDA